MGRIGCSLLRLGAVAFVFLGPLGVAKPSCAQTVQKVGAETVSLTEAIRRAQQNEPVFAGVLGAQRSSSIDRYLAKAALLPSVTYHNQMLYTQPNGQTNQGGQVGTSACSLLPQQGVPRRPKTRRGGHGRRV